MEQEDYGVIIIGSGPAGLTAGIYSSRARQKTLILEKSRVGGRTAEIRRIENFPGFPEGISGEELIERMTKHAEKFGVEIITDEEVIALNLRSKTKIINTRKSVYRCSALIIAIGVQSKKLWVLGELEFLGKGVSYCATCDALFFKDRVVAVVGYKDKAVEEALLLADVASKVILIPNGEELKIEKALKKRMNDKKNIQILNAKVEAVEGDSIVKSLKIADLETNEIKKLPVDGIFISMGYIPMAQLIENAGIEIDNGGCIEVDRHQRTNIEGVFAAGDCTCGGMQIVTSAGEGAMAGKAAASYVRKLK